MVSGLLPVFAVLFDLSYLLVGIVAMVFNVSSSLIQPLLGRWFDRTQVAWLLETGLIVNCVGMGLVGFSPNYVLLLFLIGTAGVGSAAFHPPAFSAVTRTSGPSKGRAMGIFVSGGNIGQFLGPIVAGVLVSTFGPHGTFAILPVGLVTAALLFKVRLQKSLKPTKVAKSHRPDMRLLVLLATITAIRSISTQNIINFLPLYFVESGDPLLLATAITSLWVGVGVLGQIAGGVISDRFNSRIVVVSSLLLGGIVFYGFLITHGVLSLILLGLSGALLYASWSVIVVMSTQAAPNNVGAVSGFMLGFSVGIGGLAAVGLGAVGDVLGLTYAFYLITASAIFGGLVSLLLPKI